MSNSILSTKVCLSRQLPYDPSTKHHGNLRKALYEYELLLNGASAAFGVLETKNPKKIDPVVGNHACEAQALIVSQAISQSFEKIKEFEATKNEILESKDKVQKLLESKSIEVLMKRGISLKGLLEENKLDIALTKEQEFIIQSYILTLATVREPPKPGAPFCRNDKITEKKILDLDPRGNVSSNFAKQFVRESRKNLSLATVNFLQEQAHILNDETLITMSSSTSQVSNLLTCIPMYTTYQIVLVTAKRNGTPLVLFSKFYYENNEKILQKDEKFLFFEPIGNQFKLKQYEAEDLDRIAIMIEGATLVNDAFNESDWKDKVSESIEDIILANAANHDQLPSFGGGVSEPNSLTSLETDQKFQYYKSIKGCSLADPHLFLTVHVSAEKIENIAYPLRTLS